MFDWYQFYLETCSRYPESVAAAVFDIHYNFWLSCGDEMQKFDEFRYIINHRKF